MSKTTVMSSGSGVLPGLLDQDLGIDGNHENPEALKTGVHQSMFTPRESMWVKSQ